MDKKILIGGGIAVAAIGLFLIKKAKAAAQQTAQVATPVSADMGQNYAFMSSLAPTSGGYSDSGSSVSAAATPTSAPATTSGGGGGFDLTSLIGGLLTSQTTSNQSAIVANQQNTDAAILSTIAPGNGTVTVSHSTSGTTITNSPSGDMYDQAITQVYKDQLNRAPDTGGLAFFKNAMMNQGLSIVDVTKNIQASAEYKQTHPTS